MKKMIYLVSSYFIFLNGMAMFSQTCVNNIDEDFNADYANSLSYLAKTAIVNGSVDNFVIAGKAIFSSPPFLRKYNFDSTNPCAIPLHDTGFETNVSNNLPATNGVRLADIESYNTDLFAILMSNSSNYLSLINANSQVRSFLNTGFSGFSGSDIACDPTNERIYAVSRNNSSVQIAIYQIINNDVFLIRSISIAAPNPGFPRLELIPNNVQGSERLVLSYSSNLGKTISIFRPNGYFISGTVQTLASPTNNVATAAEILTLNSDNANLINLSLTYTNTFGTSSSLRALEYNPFNNRIYIAGHDQSNGSMVDYYTFQPDVNTVFPFDNLLPSSGFSSLCGGNFVNSIDFLADCRVVVAGAFTTDDNCSNSVAGNSVIIDGDTGVVLNGPLNNLGQIADIATYSAISGNGTLCESFFAAGQQGLSNLTYNYRLFTRFCIPNSSTTSSRFDYCKLNNTDGSYNVQTNGGTNLSYTLNGNPITNLTNLNGTLVITSTITYGCSNLISCYQETITNGTNCSSVDKIAQPKPNKSALISTKQIEEVKGKSVVVYPNPSKEIFTIKGDFDPNQSVEIDVYDLMAKSVLKKTVANFNNDGEDLNLKNQSSGTYIISITQGSTKITQTIIKE